MHVRLHVGDGDVFGNAAAHAGAGGAALGNADDGVVKEEEATLLLHLVGGHGVNVDARLSGRGLGLAFGSWVFIRRTAPPGTLTAVSSGRGTIEPPENDCAPAIAPETDQSEVAPVGQSMTLEVSRTLPWLSLSGDEIFVVQKGRGGCRGGVGGLRRGLQTPLAGQRRTGSAEVSRPGSNVVTILNCTP